MKKITTAACALALLAGVLPLAACGENNPPVSENEPTVGEETVTQPTIPTTPPAEEAPTVKVPTVPTVETPKPKKADYICVKCEGLNVRSGAGTGYSSLGTLEEETLLKYVGETGGWYETRYKNRTAYVRALPAYASLTSLEEGGEKTERVIDEGLRLLGTPYVYGATRYHDGKGNLLKGFTINKFDCSSLMQYIFYKGAGKLLNVNTRTQVSQGKEVEKADIQRGDLLFFTNASRQYNTGLERIGHVALYLGDNYILHTASDYAKVEQITSARWKFFITARRV